MIGLNRSSALGVAILVFAVGGGQAADEVVADRAVLTFRDSGLYANLHSVHGVDPAKDGVANLLSPERAARADTPWDFYIMQYNAEGPSPELAATIKGLARNGKKIILRVLLGKEKQKLDLARAKRRLEDLFRHTRPEWLYAITLDEENVYWFGGTRVLSELYEWTKARWPGLPVYQWWTPMVAPEVGAKSGWVALPADGWVLDLYGQPAEAFEKKLVKFLETGKPAVHIAWASPTWMFYDKEGWTKETWWAGAGRRVFDDQVRICREYNVPVAYFCCQPAERKDGKLLAPIRWGWHAVDPAVRRWFLELEALVANFDYLPAAEIGFRVPGPELFAWAHSKPTTKVEITLDDRQRKRFSWRSTFAEANTASGTHELTWAYPNPYFRLRYTLARSEHLRSGLAIPSIDGRGLTVPIIFTITPLKAVADWAVTAEATALPELGGSVRVEASGDGTNWSPAAATTKEGGHRQTLSVGADALGGVSGRSPVHVRVILRANAGVETNIAARLEALSVSGSLGTPLPGTPRLSPVAPVDPARDAR